VKKYLLISLLIAVFMFSTAGLCWAIAKPSYTGQEEIKLEAPTLQMASQTAVQIVKQNPVSLPDWWEMTTDIAGNMVIEALKTGNLFLTLNGIPGAFIDIYQGDTVNFTWGVNRDGNYIGIMPAHILSFQDRFGVELLRKARPQIWWNYGSGEIKLGLAYDFRGE